jgi:hypothetical protein
MGKTYLAKFRQGSGAMAMNATDFYRENGKIIKHDWAMGGETKKEVATVPTNINGYRRIAFITMSSQWLHNPVINGKTKPVGEHENITKLRGAFK